MHPTAPHFLLYSEAAAAADSQQALPGRWRFVLRPTAGGESLQAADDEDGATPERLELLAIVRALESLDQPSRVTLVTASRNVRRGLNYGLPLWSENGWQWERFGQMTPVKNGDLWRRIDRALEIHALDCRAGQIEKADDLAQPDVPPAPPPQFRRTRRGRVVRVDQPARKSEARNLKHETNSKLRFQKVCETNRSRHSRFRNWSLSRISSFVLRASPGCLRQAFDHLYSLIRN